MTKPLISVLIPCFNAAPYIAQTLESVFAQTWPNLEVVVVNDGSTDNSAEVIQRFARPNLVFLDQNNLGAATSRNDAFAACSGEYIQWLDADDLISPNKLTDQMARLADHSRSVACAAWGRFTDDPAEARFVPDGTWKDMEPIDWLAESRSGGHRMMFPALWLIPRHVAVAAGPWNPELTLADDTEYFTRLLLQADGVLFCPNAKAYYRSSVSGSLSGRKTRAAWMSAYKVNLLCDEYLFDREDSTRIRRGSAITWQDYAYSVFPFDETAAELAMQRARQMDRSAITPPPGGFAFRMLAVLLGWRAALQIKQALREQPHPR